MVSLPWCGQSYACSHYIHTKESCGGRFRNVLIHSFYVLLKQSWLDKNKAAIFKYMVFFSFSHGMMPGSFVPLYGMSLNEAVASVAVGTWNKIVELSRKKRYIFVNDNRTDFVICRVIRCACYKRELWAELSWGQYRGGQWQKMKGWGRIQRVGK